MEQESQEPWRATASFLLPLVQAQPDFFLLCLNFACVAVHMSTGVDLFPPGAEVKSGPELPHVGAGTQAGVFFNSSMCSQPLSTVPSVPQPACAVWTHLLRDALTESWSSHTNQQSRKQPTDMSTGQSDPDNSQVTGLCQVDNRTNQCTGFTV